MLQYVDDVGIRVNLKSLTKEHAAVEYAHINDIIQKFNYSTLLGSITQQKRRYERQLSAAHRLKIVMAVTTNCHHRNHIAYHRGRHHILVTVGSKSHSSKITRSIAHSKHRCWHKCSLMCYQLNNKMITMCFDSTIDLGT